MTATCKSIYLPKRKLLPTYAMLSIPILYYVLAGYFTIGIQCVRIPSKIRAWSIRSYNFVYKLGSNDDINAGDPFTLPAQSSQLSVADSKIYQVLQNGTHDSLVFQGLPNKNRKPVLIARLVSWILKKLVESRLQSHSGLELNVISDSNKAVMRGKVDTIELKFDRLEFGQVFVSGGGRVILEGLDLRMRRFLFQNLQTLRKPYRIYFDLLLTQSDIVNSKFIRYLLQLLVNTILSNVLRQASDVLKVEVKKVTIRDCRIQAQGEVSLISGGLLQGGPLITFEVSTGAGVRDGGQVLYLRDIVVVLNPDSALRTVVPVLLTTPIDVDLGAQCRLESLVVGQRHIWLRAVSVISPVPSFPVVTAPRRALYQYDLAALLSSLLRVQGGLIPYAVGWK